ncbi:MAG: D-alanyl-D-alanine carboxypeptidase [Clostridia bacterium]|nr:D-alanyl-D-alanine carboxypeptidase [Clostridia bacterium]
MMLKNIFNNEKGIFLRKLRTLKDYFKNFIIFFIIIMFLSSNNVFADDEIEEFNDIDEDILITSSNTVEEPETYSKYIICMERSTKRVLFEKNAYAKTPMASTTKILTAIIALEKCSLNEEVHISQKAAGTGGSTLGITSDTTMTMESLLYGLLLRSGNDCAVAISEHIGGSVEEFAKLMNEKAVSLGLTNSHFVTPHGLDSDEHYTTAYDLAILTDYALNNSEFKKIVGTKQIDIMIGGYSRTLNNTNELLGNVQGVYGVKTGFTGNAGRCLVTACKRENLDVIVVVLGADTKKIRGIDSKSVLEYVFNNYEMINTEDLVKKAFENYNNSINIKLLKSQSKIKINYTDNFTYIYPINKNKIPMLKTSIYCISVINAPLVENSTIGKLRVMCENEILYEIDIKISQSIEKMNWKDYFKSFICNYKKYYKIKI